MVVVNSWLLYQRECEALGAPHKKQTDQTNFKLSVASNLCQLAKTVTKKRENLHFLQWREILKRRTKGTCETNPRKCDPTRSNEPFAFGNGKTATLQKCLGAKDKLFSSARNVMCTFV